MTERKLGEARTAAEVSAEFRSTPEGERLYQDAQRRHDAAEAADYFAKAILNECGCTYYPGKGDCRHKRIYDDRVAWFVAGAAWQREHGN